MTTNAALVIDGTSKPPNHVFEQTFFILRLFATKQGDRNLLGKSTLKLGSNFAGIPIMEMMAIVSESMIATHQSNNVSSYPEARGLPYLNNESLHHRAVNRAGLENPHLPMIFRLGN